MSYGWAILVVVIVGGVMWQMGIFNMGSSAPTSSGFESLKPLLATCRSGTYVWDTPYNGFTCQFLNNAGSKISLRHIGFFVNDGHCYGMFIHDTSVREPDTVVVYRYCNALGCNPISGCFDYGTSFNCGGAAGDWLQIRPDQQFTISTMSRASSPYLGECETITGGETYELSVDLTYQIDIGGISTEKHSVGTIRFSADQTTNAL